MNHSHAKGYVKEVKGKVKEEVGHTVGNSKMASSGVIDQVLGKLERGIADLKDAVKRGVDAALDKTSHPTEKKR